MATENPAPFLRLFLALAVPPEVRREIGRAQARLQRNSPPGTIRWAPLDQFHITLKFLGDVPAEHVTALQTSLGPVCAACPALQLSAEGIGFFPNARKPRVIWAGARDTGGRLGDLHGRIEEALRWLAPNELPEKFAGHITLGRLKPGGHAGIPKLIELARNLRERHFGEWRADQVELVRSELTPVRAEHTAMAAFPLGAWRATI